MKYSVLLIFLAISSWIFANPSERNNPALEHHEKIFTSLIDELAAIDAKDKFSKEDDRLTALLNAVEEYWKKTSPLWSYMSGEQSLSGLWWDNSVRGDQLYQKANSTVLEKLAEIDKNTLSKEQKLNYNLLSNELENNRIWYKENLNLLAIENQWGIHSVITGSLSEIRLEKRSDWEHYISLLGSADILVDNVIEKLKTGIDKKITKPIVTVNKVEEQIEKLIQKKSIQNTFLAPLKEHKLPFDGKMMAAKEKEAEELINQRLVPALKRLKTFMNEKYMPACTESIALGDLPGGEDKYAYQIKYHTTTNLGAKEIHEKGLVEVKRIKAEMLKIIEELEYDGDFNAFNEFLRTDPQFYYTSKEDLLQGYRDICKKVDPQLIRYFGHLPRTPYGVKAVPDYLEKTATTAYYSGGSYKGGEPGYFYANTYDLKSRPKYEMTALALHEAVPGHHLQIAIADELSEQHEFRKRISSTAYVEGWALYAESLGEEMNMYEDPYDKYGQLTYEIWRAIRLVVDTGIHAFGWSREEAIQYFIENSPKTRHDIEVEVDRYISWPGQALAYKIGELEIKKMRKEGENKLGENFDLRGFHDLILGNGVLPLNVLESKFEEWLSNF